MVQMGHVLTDTEGWQHMAGWSWGWMVLGWVFWLSVIVVVVWVVERVSSGTPRNRRPEQIRAEQ